MCIINCDAPASKTRGLSVDGRMCYFKTFHDKTGADPSIWRDNFNTGLIQLDTLLQDIGRRCMIKDRGTSNAEQPGITKVVFSHPLRYKRGDLALTCGLHIAQLNSDIGQVYNGASAEHDLVIAK